MADDRTANHPTRSRVHETSKKPTKASNVQPNDRLNGTMVVLSQTRRGWQWMEPDATRHWTPRPPPSTRRKCPVPVLCCYSSSPPRSPSCQPPPTALRSGPNKGGFADEMAASRARESASQTQATKQGCCEYTTGRGTWRETTAESVENRTGPGRKAYSNYRTAAHNYSMAPHTVTELLP